MGSAARVGEADRLARALVSATHTCDHEDPLDDSVVDMVLQDIRQTGAAGIVLEVLADMVAFGCATYSTIRVVSGDGPLTFDDMEDLMCREQRIDVDLVRDCFEVLRTVDRPPDRAATASVIGRTLHTWGPYALVTVGHVYLRLVNSLAELHDEQPEDVLARLAVAHEHDLEKLGRAGSARPDQRQKPNPETDGA